MFSAKSPPQRNKDEGERPFWISYADLMTALMVLFLIVMVASLVSITQQLSIETDGEKQRTKDIVDLCMRLEKEANFLKLSIQVDCKDNRINFGEAGRFNTNRYDLPAEGHVALQAMVPLILNAAESPEGKRWMKQILIEGFTDTDGSYLYNLHLSLQRSEWVMCSLLDSNYAQKTALSDEQKMSVMELFLAGGVSFNNPKDSKDASRRVELRMQFYGLKDDKKAEEKPEFKITKSEICQLKKSHE